MNPVLYIEKHSAIAESFVKGYKGTDVSIGLVNINVLELRYLFDNTKSNNNLGEQERNLMYDKIGNALDQIEKLGKVVTFAQYLPFYVKHYEDDLYRNEEIYKDYRFYDEREWCYVPKELQTSNELYKSAKEYNIWRKGNQDKQFLRKVSLDFSFDDIIIWRHSHSHD